jgi:hypothetical protein
MNRGGGRGDECEGGMLKSYRVAELWSSGVECSCSLEFVDVKGARGGGYRC